jgi:hypothetical protein
MKADPPTRAALRKQLASVTITIDSMAASGTCVVVTLSIATEVTGCG